MSTQRTNRDISLTPEPGAALAASLPTGRDRTAREVVRAASRPFRVSGRTGSPAATPRAAPRVGA